MESQMVGAVRFELTTSCTRNKRATRLRYAPNQGEKKVPGAEPDCNFELLKSFLHVTILPKPVHRIGQCLPGRGLRQVQFANRFDGVEKHLVSSHADASQGSLGRLVRKKRE